MRYWPALVLALVMLTAVGVVLFVVLVRSHRGEEAGVPEEPMPEQLSREDARDALDEVLADDDVTWRRLQGIEARWPRLLPNKLVRQINQAYAREVDR